MDLVTPSQQRRQTYLTLRDSRITRTTVKQQQAFYNGVVLEISNKKSTNQGDYYQNRLTLKDSYITRTAIKLQMNNVRLGDYTQIRLRPIDKAAKPREDYYQNRLTLRNGYQRQTLKVDSAADIGCLTRGQLSSKVGEGT